MDHEPLSLVVGADGTIGAALFGAMSARGMPVIGTTRRADSSNLHPLDLADPALRWNGPGVSVAYLCAAQTSLEACERDPQGSARINVEGTLRLAEQLMSQGAFLVFFSTNHVFDGSQPQRTGKDKTCPFNEYGRQKALVEQQLLASGKAAVLRLTKVIGPTVPLFDRWVDSVRQGLPIRPFVDLSLAPVKLARVVEVACRIGSRRLPGVFQLSGDVDLSYFDAARIGMSALGLDLGLVAAGELRNNGATKLMPPRFTSLQVSRLDDLSLEPLETSEQTIRDYFATKAAA